jgi:hypothetical protein
MRVKQNINRKWVAFGVALCFNINLWAGTPPAPPDDKNEKQVEIKQNDVVQFLETLEIFGRVEKPQTVFIIPGKDPKVDDIMVKREFFKEIFRVVEKPTINSKKVKMKDAPFIPY